MHEDSANSQVFGVTGAIRFSELEGGSWQLELDESHEEFGTLVVVQSWPGGDSSPPSIIGDGSRVRARVREAAAQYGIAMAPGPYVEVVEIAPLG